MSTMDLCYLLVNMSTLGTLSHHRKIRAWNSLPSYTAEADSPAAFKGALEKFLEPRFIGLFIFSFFLFPASFILYEECSLVGK